MDHSDHGPPWSSPDGPKHGQRQGNFGVLAAFAVMFTALALGLSPTLPGSAAAQTNEQATLEVTKECIGTDDGTDFTITVSPGGYSTVLGCGESDTFFVDPGSYTAAETPPAGWTGPNIRGGCDGDGTITLEAGDEETCVVQNVTEEATATLIIEKECIGTDDGADFTISVSPGGFSTVLGCGEMSDGITIESGVEYVVFEDAPDGWLEPAIRGACDGDGTVTLDEGEDGTCVVRNTPEEEPLPPANIVVTEVPQPPAVPVEQVAGVQQAITPPNTGDGGFPDTGRSSTGLMIPMLILTGAIGLVTALSAKRLRHLKR